MRKVTIRTRRDTRDETFMRMALVHAETALKAGWIPVGAVFIKDNRVIAHGAKMGTVHTLFDHAEHNGCYQALWSRDGPKNLAGVEVYSTMEPCVLCMAMLMITRVRRITYGIEDPYGGGAYMISSTRDMPERFRKEKPELKGAVLRGESKKLLRQFFESRRNSGGSWADASNPLVKLVFDEA